MDTRAALTKRITQPIPTPSQRGHTPTGNSLSVQQSQFNFPSNSRAFTNNLPQSRDNGFVQTSVQAVIETIPGETNRKTPTHNPSHSRVRVSPSPVDYENSRFNQDSLPPPASPALISSGIQAALTQFSPPSDKVGLRGVINPSLSWAVDNTDDLVGNLASYYQSEEAVGDSHPHPDERTSSASGTLPRFDNQPFEEPSFSTLSSSSLSVLSPDSFGFVTPSGKRLIRLSGDQVAIEKKYKHSRSRHNRHNKSF